MTIGGTIHIVGLGPGDPRMRTVAVHRCLDAASTILLRTAVHPGLDDLVDDPRVETCDDIYESAVSFDEVYARIADRVVERASSNELVYAVPGHPLFAERSVELVCAGASKRDIAVTIVGGMSAMDAVAEALGVDPIGEQVQCLDALSLETEGSNLEAFTVDPYRPMLISQIHAPQVASTVKLFLSELLPDEHPVQVVRAGAVPGEERITRCQLHELDHQPVDYLTSVWVAALPPLAGARHWATLIALVARLRAPDGCPWDRFQTHASLRQAVLDEAYEVVDAIDAGDMDNLAEELGDLLLVVAMQAQIADEEDAFSIRDSLEAVTTKLVRRHPHVFGELELGSPDEVLRTWQGIKAAEREAKGQPAKSDDPVERLPRSMPALSKAAKVLEKHRIDLSVEQSEPDQGEKLLSLVSEIVESGDDPEAVLLEALRKHVMRQTTRSVE